MSGVESLTPSEQRIAAMAAQAMTNRDIAQALFVTPKTVEMHLNNIFRKLGISSRTQLPQAPTAQPAQQESSHSVLAPEGRQAKSHH
jgi:DNA-binding CsgD family transcriptional regulator